MPASTPPKPQAPRQRPLPDAVAIRSMPVPLSAPPYDDDLPDADPSVNAAPSSSELGPVPVPISPSAATPEPLVPRETAVRPDSGVDELERPAPLRDPPGHWPSQFAQVLVETLAGSRPPSQIAPWTTDQARRRISRLGAVLSTNHQPRIRRVVVTSPAGGVLELAIVVGLGTRVRALAVRLERTYPASDQSRPSSQRRAPGQPCPEMRAKLSNQARSAAVWICTAIEAA
jgi:hypothetical protein